MADDLDLSRPDLLSLGKVCSFSGCGTRDFLPFSCSFCRKVYCLEHKSHGCAPESTQVLVCPICAKAVRLPAGSSSSSITEQAAAQAFDAHARSRDCDPSNYERVHGKKKRCPGTNCKEKIGPSNRYDCKSCGETTCLRHRHASDHGCAERTAANAAAARGRATRSWASRFSGSGGSRTAKGAADNAPSLARTASQKLKAFFACASPAGKGQPQQQQQRQNQNEQQHRVPPAAAAAAAAARRLAGNNNKGNSNAR